MKKIYTSILLTIFLIGCGGGGGASSSSGSTTGTAVDPYIKGATFFWDKDEDGIKDTNEPLSTASDESGLFTFNVTVPVNSRVVMYDKGEHNGVSYTGQLSANLSSSGVVSPLTTLEVTYPSTDIVSMLSDANITISSDDIHKDPMKELNVNHLAATIAVDTYLKINDFNNVDKNSTTLKDIVRVTKKILDNNTSTSNIENTVSMVDYLTSKVEADSSLDELTKFDTNSSYLNSAKNILHNRTNKAKPAKLHFKNGTFSSKVAKKNSKLLDDKTFIFSDKPTKNTSVTLTLNIDSIDSSDDVNWSVETQPDGSDMNLTVASNKKSITFTPTVAGDYIISLEISNDTNSSTRTIPFNVKEVFSMDIAKVQSYSTNAVSKNLQNSSSGNAINGGTNDTNATEEEKKVGPISNQSWVFSKSLTTAQIKTLIAKYSNLTDNNQTDSIKGVLIEYNPSSASAKEDIESLKLETGIDSVINRVYEGKKSQGSFAIYPDEGSSAYSNNWHLDAIEMPDAWEYTTGSEEFLVGVCDGGFDTKHSDLTGRFATILTSAQHSHGMGVTGAIAANSNNQIGMSGINWKSQVVASYMGLSYVNDVINTKKNNKEVKLVSNSWGTYLPSNFDPTNTQMANDRFIWMQKIRASYRQLIQYYDNKLFLWAAGNGVGNGASYTGFYGCDAKYSNGAMHYKDSILNKLDNLLIVSAFANQGTNSDVNSDKTLVYYSDWGASADIAAPTHFDSLALNNGKYASFGGTSAATPVVSAVASLIMSINPKLTPAEVKSILINSATTYATKRYKSPYSSATENLANPIPVLNAKRALEMASETVTKKVGVSAKISDMLTPKLKLTYTSFDSKYKVKSVSSSVSSSSTDGSYASLNSASSLTNIIEVTLDPNKRYHEITSTITFEHIATSDTSTQEHTYKFAYSDLTIKSIDNITLETLGSTDLNISRIGSVQAPTSTTTDASTGIEKVYLTAGEYRVSGVKSSYRQTTKDITILEKSSHSIDLSLTPDAQPSVGSISGTVTDEYGTLMPGVSVRISGGAQTNGYFASAITDENGYYKITSISKRDENNATIADFNMTASLETYAPVLRENVIVLEGKERTENFTLVKAEVIPDNEYIYINDFEDNVTDWNATGMWHQVALADNNITNVNIAKGNVLLANNDDSNGTLPSASSGSKAFWYGQDSAGNFIGTESGSYPGGMSTAANSGTLISPEITIPTDINSTLSFDTWWEIEGVNPNSSGYDRMFIYIIKSDTSEVLLKKLNPAIDPKYPHSLRKPRAFTSAGFHIKPIWAKEEFSLNAYAGQTIKLKFYFETKDANYNGFRGWIIDNLKIIDNAKLNN